MTKATFSFNQAAAVVFIALASMFIGAGLGAGLGFKAAASGPDPDLKRGEEAIAEDMGSKREHAELLLARMRDQGCSSAQVLEAQQAFNKASSYTEDALETMRKGYFGLSYRWALRATERYARLESHAHSCLQAGGAQ